ncbi:MAG: DUF4166 domain-containing protein [Hyphomicrobiaceae bacterium]
MTETTVETKRPTFPHRASGSIADTSWCAPRQAPDQRFARLLGDAAWHTLPARVRYRFSRHLAPGETRLFRGRVVSTRLSLAGRIFAQLARVAGSPLPETDGASGPATVLVTEAPTLGGQVWTRTYTRARNFPQTINSVKRFSGPTGLEEYLGHGLVMRLRLAAEDGCLVFRSAGYDVLVAGQRIPLPRWLTPGTCTITHRDLGGGVFAFTLGLEHAWLGELVHQVAHFEEVQ